MSLFCSACTCFYDADIDDVIDFCAGRAALFRCELIDDALKLPKSVKLGLCGMRVRECDIRLH